MLSMNLIIEQTVFGYRNLNHPSHGQVFDNVLGLDQEASNEINSGTSSLSQSHKARTVFT